MYAIIETGGKQLRVEEGSVIYVEKLDAEENSEVVFDKVVLLSDKTTKVGAHCCSSNIYSSITFK